MKIKFNVLAFSFYSILGVAFALGTKESSETTKAPTRPTQQPVQQSGTAPQPVPVPIASAAAKCDHALAIGTDGTLWAWGSNFLGFLGDGTREDKTTPVQIGTDKNWAQVSPGQIHSMAIKTDGTLWAWGNNYDVQLGDGTREARRTPVQIGILNEPEGRSFQSKDNNWKTVSAGYKHTLAVKTDGTLWAWGYEEMGDIAVLLGLGAPGQTYIPYQIGTDKNWATVAAGEGYSLAIKTDGTLWGWGHFKVRDSRNRDVTIFKRQTPAQIGTARNWSKVWTNLSHVIALTTDGTLWGFGENSTGELGINSRDEYRLTPVQIGTDRNWATAAIGWSHTIALKTDGTLWAWGRNAVGEFGNGERWNESRVPIRIGTLNKWKSVSAGNNRTFAVTDDGVLWAWGSNKNSWLGDSTATDRVSPVTIAVMSTGRAPVVQSRTNPVSVSVKTGWFIDPRDQHIYRTVTIGNLTWLAENLRYDTKGNNWVNRLMGGENQNIALYGRLYDWEAAKEAIPPGWRLPTRSDWENLARTIGGIRKTEIGANNIEVAYWEDIGKALKSKNTWRNYYGEPGYGPDVLNFSAMPGGDNGPNYGDAYPENHGRWWTATESSAGTRWIYSMLLQYNTDDLYEMALSKDWGLSVRAVRDTAPASVQVPEDRSDFALTHFSVKNTTINRNEEYEILFRLKNTMNWRSFNVYAMVDFLDKDGKRAARFGGADIDSFLAGGEDNLRAINIYRVQTPQGDMPPGQYQLRMVIEYWLNGVRTEKPITQVLPGVPAALNVTVSTVPVIRRSGGER